MQIGVHPRNPWRSVVKSAQFVVKVFPFLTKIISETSRKRCVR